MRLFCPNCGSENDGEPGARVFCKACSAAFDAPRPEPMQAPPRPVQPPVQPVAPTGWVADTRPPAPFIAPVPVPAYSAGPVTTSPLAIISLVTGLLCCGPFPIAALITGFLAIKQIDSSQGAVQGKGLAIAGLVLGFLGMGLNFLWLIGTLAGH